MSERVHLSETKTHNRTPEPHLLRQQHATAQHIRTTNTQQQPQQQTKTTPPPPPPPTITTTGTTATTLNTKQQQQQLFRQAASQNAPPPASMPAPAHRSRSQTGATAAETRSNVAWDRTAWKLSCSQVTQGLQSPLSGPQQQNARASRQKTRWSINNNDSLWKLF